MSALHRITLDPLLSSDAPDVFPLWSDRETVRFTNWAYTPTPDECALRVDALLAHYGKEPRHFGPLAIRLADRGFIGLAGADLEASVDGQYDVWYILRRDQWGKGLGTLALGALLDRMIASGRVKRATATAVTDNRGSWALLERHGFTRGALVAGGHTKHGEALDLFEYSRTF